MRNRILTATLLLVAGLGLLLLPVTPITNPAGGWSVTGRVYAGEMPAEDHWEDEFALVSSKASMAMALSIEELQELVKQCDAIRPSIEALEETPRKIYLKRLEKTKSLYLFVIGTRNRPAP